MNTIIRKAIVEDVDALFALAQDFAASFAVEENAFRASFELLANDTNAYLLAAEIDNRTIGYALAFSHHTFFANGRVAWIEEVMVHSDFRKQGIGKALVQNIEVWATNQNCRLIALATRRATAFYKAMKYEDSATYYRKVFS